MNIKTVYVTNKELIPKKIKVIFTDERIFWYTKYSKHKILENNPEFSEEKSVLKEKVKEVKTKYSEIVKKVKRISLPIKS